MTPRGGDVSPCPPMDAALTHVDKISMLRVNIGSAFSIPADECFSSALPHPPKKAGGQGRHRGMGRWTLLGPMR